MERINTVKIWFQDIVSRLRNFNQLPPTEEPFQNGLTLPPEVLESILERVDDHNTLLQCRLVCTQWKHIINSLLERRRLSLLTNWDQAFNGFRWTQFLNPSISVVLNLHTREYVLILPSALRVKKLSENQFPYNFIAIVNKHEEWQQNLMLLGLHQWRNIGLVRFVQQTGHFLTSLLFHEVSFSQSDFTSILGAVLSLKVILFSSVKVHTRSSAKVDVKFSPHLTHLYIVNSYDLHQDSLGNYLAYLIEKTEYLPPIQYLSVIPHPKFYVKCAVEQTNIFMNLVSKISNNLIHIRTRLHVPTMLNFLTTSGVTIPNLKTFEIIMLKEGNWEEASLKEIISPAFPKLETLTFIV